MSDNKPNIYKPLCAVLAATTVFAAKGNFDNSREISSLKTDLSQLSDSYASLETDYEVLSEQQSEVSLQVDTPNYYSNHTYTPADEDFYGPIGDIYVWRVTGGTEVYHTNRNCHYIKNKSSSDVLKISYNEAQNEGLRLCSDCVPID